MAKTLFGIVAFVLITGCGVNENSSTAIDAAQLATMEPAEQQEALHALFKKAQSSGKSQFKHKLPADLVRDVEYVSIDKVGGISSGLIDDQGNGRKVTLFGGYTLARGTLNQSVMRGKGDWLLANLDGVYLPIKGSMKITKISNGVIVASDLPDDELLFINNPDVSGGTIYNGTKAIHSRITGAAKDEEIAAVSGVKDRWPNAASNFVMPTAPGSIFQIHGSVENLFPGLSVSSAQDASLYFAFIDDLEFVHLLGQGEVTDQDGKVVTLK